MNEKNRKYLDRANKLLEDSISEIEREYECEIKKIESKYEDEIKKLERYIEEIKRVDVERNKEIISNKEQKEVNKLKLEEISIRERKLKAENEKINEREEWVLKQLREIKKREEAMIGIKIEGRNDEDDEIEFNNNLIEELLNSIEKFNNDTKKIEEKVELVKRIDFNKSKITDKDKYAIGFTLILFNEEETLNKYEWGEKFLNEKNIVNLIKLIEEEKRVREFVAYKKIPIIVAEQAIKDKREINEKLIEGIVKLYSKKLKKYPKEIYDIESKERDQEFGKTYNGKFYIEVRDEKDIRSYIYGNWGKFCIDKSKAFVDVKKIPQGYGIIGMIIDEQSKSAIRLDEKYTFIPTESSFSGTSINQNNLLNEESKLKKLGYSTSLNKVEREEIIKNTLIPKLGKKVVENHLIWLIKFNRKKAFMENAVIIWQYDLNLIQQLSKIGSYKKQRSEESVNREKRLKETRMKEEKRLKAVLMDEEIRRKERRLLNAGKNLREEKRVTTERKLKKKKKEKVEKQLDIKKRLNTKLSAYEKTNSYKKLVLERIEKYIDTFNDEEATVAMYIYNNFENMKDYKDEIEFAKLMKVNQQVIIKVLVRLNLGGYTRLVKKISDSL